MEGWIKLHRQIEENDIWHSERFTQGQAWVDLLLLATHKEQTVFLKGVEFRLLPGQLCWSQVSLADRWRWNRKTVKKFLLTLKKSEMLDIETKKGADIGFTLITIRNYSKYQDKENDTLDIETDRGEGHSKGHLLDNNKKDQEGIKKEEYGRMASPNSFSPIVVKTIRRLNELSGKHYRPDSKNITKNLRAQLKEGFTETDFLLVVDDRWRRWKNKPDMLQHFNPDTLFRPSKFELYLTEAKDANGRDGEQTGGGFVG